MYLGYRCSQLLVLYGFFHVTLCLRYLIILLHLLDTLFLFFKPLSTSFGRWLELNNKEQNDRGPLPYSFSRLHFCRQFIYISLRTLHFFPRNINLFVHSIRRVNRTINTVTEKGLIFTLCPFHSANCKASSYVIINLLKEHDMTHHQVQPIW